MNEGLFFIEHLPFANIESIWIDTRAYLMIYVFILTMIFAFLYRNKRLIYSAILILFILTFSWALSKIRQQEISRIIFYSLRKNPGIGFFEGRSAFIITDLKKGGKIWSYAIKPSVESAGMQTTRIIRPGTMFSGGNFFYDRNFIQFRNIKLMFWDKTFNRKVFPNRVAVDMLLLQGNPNVTIKSLLQSVRFKILLIDATNADYRIRNWEKESKEYGIECYVLKGNPAYVINI